MYKLCKTELSAQRQRQMEMGLLEAMCVQRYEEISVSDLCDRLQVPRKSFYRYFSGKDGALHALLDHTILEYDQLTTSMSTGNFDLVQKDMTRFFKHWLQHRRLLDALERSGLSGILVERAISQAHREYGAPALSQTAQERLLHNHTIAFMACGLMSMALQWHHLGYRESPQEMAQIAAQVVTRPLANITLHY